MGTHRRIQPAQANRNIGLQCETNGDPLCTQPAFMLVVFQNKNCLQQRISMCEASILQLVNVHAYNQLHGVESFFEKLVVAQLIKKLPVFQGAFPKDCT
jgi:hypothetical protein